MIATQALAPSQAAAPPGVLGELLAKRRAVVMGILNLTPDSFSDGGEFIDPARAIAHARLMIDQGADIIDIGAESTRPYGGMKPVDAEEELERLKPVLSAVVGMGVPVSIDTLKAGVADWALEHGARIANDVWGLQHDPDMAAVVARHRVPVIVMHNRDNADPGIDIMSDLIAFFRRSLEIARKAGVPREALVLDPGIGFGKTPEQSIEALARLDMLKEFGLPLLVGASRKRFIASVSPVEPKDRIGGSIAAHVMAYLNGAAIIRTHDVAETVQALRIAAALRDAR